VTPPVTPPPLPIAANETQKKAAIDLCLLVISDNLMPSNLSYSLRSGQMRLLTPRLRHSDCARSEGRGFRVPGFLVARDRSLDLENQNDSVVATEAYAGFRWEHSETRHLARWRLRPPSCSRGPQCLGDSRHTGSAGTRVHRYRCRHNRSGRLHA